MKNENRIGPKEITFSKIKAVTLELRMLSSIYHKASLLVLPGSLPFIPSLSGLSCGHTEHNFSPV